MSFTVSPTSIAHYYAAKVTADIDIELTRGRVYRITDKKMPVRF
ncbi:hypothetical protein ymoll0001_20120 [Yersinia mollaretii ATCC 43969]|uniref:Uncharacterized protein n=1 Tax=Yersinia mollaretii (strain ATCC 43969 / DSM 18520 / CIP 103324 / CNY 7263 / WAIP 204) TaxID=349967 RepID=A0ABP2EGE2_YERMW|nr:hypothetical protein ymoll0001_20120 [Yersinia mollaretii ATCC 43969]